MTESSPTKPSASSTAAVDDAPAVVAVCVSERADEDFDACLSSLVAQNYPNLSILVIDAGNPEPITDRVAAIAPTAYLQRLQGAPGFAAAANQALSLVQDAAFLLICRENVQLHERTVTAMVEEMFRSNAGVVTPKIVEWDDPRRLVAVGMGADQFGVKVDLVEPREFDQEQHDGVRDVFVAPAGVQLIRRDLFVTLGGFDASMGSENEDLDLSWRAHVVGARIVVSPVAPVRQRPAESDDHASRLMLRNRLRSLLVTGSRWTLARSLPIAVLLLLSEAVTLFLTGKRSRAASVLGILPSTITDLGEIRQRRAELEAVRQISDHEVRALQVGGSARVNEYVRDRFGAGQDRLVDLVGSAREDVSDDELASQRVAALGGLLLVLLWLFGSRSLISEGVAPIGQIPVLPGADDLLGEWWSGWRSVGTGREAAAPVAFLVLGALRVLFFWSTGLLDTLLVIGPLVIGAIGAWRLCTPLGSPRAAIAATFAYTCNPLPLAIIAAGRWPVLVLWAAAPFVIISILRLQMIDPFRSPHPQSVRLLRFGLLVAAIATFAPTIIPLAVLALLALSMATIIVARPMGLRPSLLAMPVAVLVPAALHLPFSWQVVADGSWRWLMGGVSPDASFDSMADLIRFAPGLAGPGVLVIGAVAVGFGGLVIARGTRFDLAASGLTLAVVAWAVAWASRRWLTIGDVPAADALLCLAASGLALAVGAAVRAVEVDGVRVGRTRRLAIQGVAIGGLALTVLLGFQSSLDGRWGLGRQSHIDFAQLLFEAEDGPVRALWIGSPAVLPIDGTTSGGGIHFAVTDGEEIDIVNRYSPGASAFDAEVGDRLDLVVAGQTDQLGRLLAAYGIDLVIVVPTLAPPPYGGPTYPAGSGIESVLPRQLDLQRINGTLGLRVYRNIASSGPAFASDAAPPSDVSGQLAMERSQLVPLDVRSVRTGSWRGVAPDGLSDLDGFVLFDASGWESGDGTTMVAATEAFARFRLSDDGPIQIAYPTSTISRLGLLVQLLAIGAALIVAQPDRDQARSFRTAERQEQ